MSGGRSLTVLGCGTSVGVPQLGCACKVCTSANPRNRRTRASALLRLPGGVAVVDTTPEMRLQLLREGVKLVSAVVYTHYHADHLFGLDDVRVFPRLLGGPVPLYCTAEVERVVRQVFSYAFPVAGGPLPGAFIPSLEFRRITAAPFELLGETVTPVPLRHAHFDVFGYRVGDVAYCTDVNEIPAESWPLLEGLDVLILDALRPGQSHPSHFSLEDALEVAERLKPRRTYLTHMSHEMDYDSLPALLPAGVALAYDGLSIDF